MLRRLLGALAILALAFTLSATAQSGLKSKASKKDEKKAGKTSDLVKDAKDREERLRQSFEAFKLRLALLRGRLITGTDQQKRQAESIKKVLDKRYGGLTLEPRKIAFIDRIVADSRDVALNHTAGLSLPQQVMMTLFSIAELMDEKKAYQKACIGIVKKRVDATIEGLGIEVSPNELFDYYYGLIDFEFFARKHLGEDMVQWLKANEIGRAHV